MKKQLKDLTSEEIHRLCTDDCNTCNYYNSLKKECILSLEHMEQYSEEWIEWDEEETVESQTKTPKGFIEVVLKDYSVKTLLALRHIVLIKNAEEIGSIITITCGEVFIVQETYEEIKAKIAEALR